MERRDHVIDLGGNSLGFTGKPLIIQLLLLVPLTTPAAGEPVRVKVSFERLEVLEGQENQVAITLAGRDDFASLGSKR